MLSYLSDVQLEAMTIQIQELLDENSFPVQAMADVLRMIAVTKAPDPHGFIKMCFTKASQWTEAIINNLTWEELRHFQPVFWFKNDKMPDMKKELIIFLKNYEDFRKDNVDETIVAMTMIRDAENDRLQLRHPIEFINQFPQYGGVIIKKKAYKPPVYFMHSQQETDDE
jgi:hypothetical protein